MTPGQLVKHELYQILALIGLAQVRCFNGALLTVYLYLLYLIATFQKAGTCLDAQQSMAKQPIKGCVSIHSRTCGKSVSENSE